MIDLDSAAAVARAAQKGHDMIAADIAAEPHGPIVAELRRIADELEELVAEYANMIRILERRTA